MGRAATRIGRGLVGLALALAVAWAALALYYLAPVPGQWRVIVAGLFAVVGLAAVVGLKHPDLRLPSAFALAVATVPVAWVWTSAVPRNDRDWQPDVAVLPHATVDGDLVTVHNIRNFDYRTETDFTPAYYDRTYDLRKLDRIDLAASYWMGPHIAHLFVSFGFGDDHLAVSIVARRDRTRPYGTLPGFFRQYELVYVVADERDAVRVRTNYRKDPPEQVYLFRLHGTAEERRHVFLDYIHDINELREHPRFYNTLTTNCTTMILAHAAANPRHGGYSWKVLLSGHGPEYAYERGRMNPHLSYSELRERGHINPAAEAADQAPDFSRRIRAHVP